MQDTFALRDTTWPPTLPLPPDQWGSAWNGYVADYGIQWATLPDAFSALRSFWHPLFDDSIADATWDAEKWDWAIRRQTNDS